jgi:hypothetical protein
MTRPFACSLRELMDELMVMGVGSANIEIDPQDAVVVVYEPWGTAGMAFSQRKGRWGAEYDPFIADPDFMATGNYEAYEESDAWGPAEVGSWAYPLLVGHGLAAVKGRPVKVG